ncbi:hypothetical protein GCM10022226_43390 [Sphaerisporangium flaviroseum]|uniref:Uncharacterized protein n=1 Tax=Sphaerisporangium flaviroseum TaxID=509199 RepID=A0ABP7IH28_9ACTN
MRVPRLLVVSAALLGVVLISPPASAAPAAQAAAGKTFSGQGDDVARITATKARAIITLTHRGEENFVVWALKPGGKQSELVVNTIGDYSGTNVFNVYSWSKTSAFEINADGDWKAVVRPISHAPLWKTATVRNQGDKVVKLKAPTRGLRTLRYKHSGDGHFAIYAFPLAGNPDLLVNKIGAVGGKVRIPAGTKYVSVSANGKWYMTRD